MRVSGFLIFLLTFLLAHQTSPAQDDYIKWLQKEQEKFQKFIDEEDKKFVEFLRKEWKEVLLEKGIPSFQEPKPIEPPKLIEKEKKGNNEIKVIPPSQPDSKPILDEHKKSQQEIQRAEEKPEKDISLEPPKKPIVVKEANMLPAEIEFYGVSIDYSYDENLRIKLKGKLDKETIADFWEALSASNYKDFLQQALSIKSKMQLNDWGYLLLLNSMAERVYPDLQNEKTLFIWFMLVKSGYLARVGYFEDKVNLLIASNNLLFEIPYLILNDQSARFYRIALDEKSKLDLRKIYTYSGEHSATAKIFEFSIKKYPTFGNEFGKREVSLSFNKKNYVINLEYDISVIRFFEKYPHTEYPIYFSTGMSNKAKENLLKNLKQHIENMSEYEAVNFLLHFVQKATDYKTDKEQFGREKPLFPEESLFYKFSDCEDRAILFSYLVSNLLNLNVIGLKFPNHVATAVKFNDNVKGDFISYKGEKYIICDPTYFGAEVGMCMPSFKNVEAKIIEW